MKKIITATLISRTRHTPSIYIAAQGGHQLLENGNLLVYWGSGEPSFTEFNPVGSVALEMDFSQHSFSNRILKSEWKHKVFETQTDHLDFGMWDGSSTISRLLDIKNNTDSTFTLSGYRTKTNHFYIEESFPISIPAGGVKQITVVYYPNTAETGYIKDVLTIQAEYADVFLAQQVELSGSLEDYNASIATITPNTSGVDIQAKIQISFTEAVRFIDNTELDYQNVDNLFTLRKDNELGEPIAYDAIVNTAKNVITLKPLTALDDNQLYYVSFGNLFEDYSNNSVNGISQTFNTGSLTGNNVLDESQNKLVISPNPSKDQFYLRLAKDGDYQIIVMDMQSKMLTEYKINSANHIILDLNPYPSGVYLVLIYSNGNLINRQKIVKE